MPTDASMTDERGIKHVESDGKGGSQLAIITFKCQDRPGIVSRMSAVLYNSGLNIIESDAHSDKVTNTWFNRVVIEDQILGHDFEDREEALKNLRVIITRVAAQEEKEVGVKFEWTLTPYLPKEKFAIFCTCF